MTVVVSDTFTRADGSLGNAETGQAWGAVQSAGSSWAIASNKATATAANLSINALETGVSDCTVSADLSSTSGDNAIAWRVTDDDNYWMIFAKYNTVYKKVAGSFTVVDNSLTATAGAGTWSVVLSGNTITVKLNGVTQTTITDSFNASATKHGLMANATAETFDNFTVTTPDAGSPPANTAAPVASGTATVGSALLCTTGTWTNSPTSYAYQWRRNGGAISGATASGYTVVSADQGTTLTCTVTATNAAGSASATSNGIAIPATYNILPNDTNIVYSPYNWNVTPARALCNNSGAYFKTMIQGGPTAINAHFDVSGLLGNLPQLWYRVDDGPWTKVTIAATIPLTMPSSTSSWTVHAVELVVKGLSLVQDKWSSAANQVKFIGISTTPSTCSARAITSRTLKVLMYGDSITEGILTIKASGGTPEIDAHDVTQCWSWQLTESLGAEVGVVGFAGQGWDVASSGVPSFADAWPMLNSAITRSFSTSPDLIVIAHGANDISGNVSPVVTSTLNAILAAVPITTLIGVVRPFAGTQAANIQAGIAACNAPKRVSYIDTTGWWSAADSSDGSHPWGYAHVNDLSPKLAIELRKVLRRGATYVNVGGTAKLISSVRA